MGPAALPDELLHDPRLFRGGQRLNARRDGVPSGQAGLDAVLPWGGFPRGALSELLIAADGIGEFSLLLPALRQLSEEAPIALVQPPYIPYAPALVHAGLPLERLVWIAPPAERVLWTAEQCLRAGCLSAVLLWDGGGDARPLRRLQVAADSGRALAFLFRPDRHRANPSPAALRLRITAGELEVVKCRGMQVPEADFSRKPALWDPHKTPRTRMNAGGSGASLASIADRPASSSSRSPKAETRASALPALHA